ncbi:MAG: hypothetical protein NC238_02930 [Dehalobacter sp.]|nr:hypothetical protein [Dehalobacter sp.]
MGLLNYTTKIDVHTTLGEIQKTLVEHGARKIMQDFDEKGRIKSLNFSMMTPQGEAGFRLPANVPQAFEVLKQQKKQGKIKIVPDYDQAERVAWRILKDWIEAQMAILETEMVQMEEIFFPYMLDRSGKTFYQAYQMRQLNLGGNEYDM